ncbi:MAG: exodeoxyribonuclease VII small subunit [Thermoflexales bacterium]|nr:exodeoxyribonuclease VII small subunit [Thermoflexales bacterium]
MAKRPTAPSEPAAPGGRARTFEAVFTELEAIVATLEKGELPLEDALVLHERGQALAAQCSQLLAEAELKLQQLPTTQAAGE